MFQIAIDGPSGAGKSTIAKALAKKLNFVYVDTGALYRTVGWAALCRNIDYKNNDLVQPMLQEITVDLTYDNGVQKVLLNGEDVSEQIRYPESSMAASGVSALPCVRQFLLDTQRAIATKNNVIMDGRDIGTVVLPDAQVKIFLTATPEDRANRRYLELQEKGIDTSYEEVLADMIRRDYNDSHREIAPLKQADDAILADTTGMELEQAIALISDIIEKAMQ
jgi:cytidylate kinase